MKSCWQLDAKVRPTAKEIVEFLANNPRLVFPCLDVPLPSVQLEDTGQLEMHLPDSFRKCSNVSLKPLGSPPLPNGTAPSARPPGQPSLSDGSLSLQMDGNCLREPLLGPVVRSSSSLMGLSKLVGHSREECENGRMNGQAVSRV